MTIGEYIRQNGDSELAGLLVNWVMTVVALIGADYRKLNLEAEYFEIIDYLQSEATDEWVSAITLFDTPSDMLS